MDSQTYPDSFGLPIDSRIYQTPDFEVHNPYLLDIKDYDFDVLDHSSTKQVDPDFDWDTFHQMPWTIHMDSSQIEVEALEDFHSSTEATPPTTLMSVLDIPANSSYMIEIQPDPATFEQSTDISPCVPSGQPQLDDLFKFPAYAHTPVRKNIVNRVHTKLNSKRGRCPVLGCKHSTDKKRDLLRHLRAKHSESPETTCFGPAPRYYCPHQACKAAIRGFSRQDNLKKHLNRSCRYLP